MIVKKVRNYYGKEMTYRYFDSIVDLKHFIDNAEVKYINGYDSNSSRTESFSFTGTESYEQAEDMLLHGWEHMAEKLTNTLNVKTKGIKQRNRTSYGVSGFQACVPRYLQGMPDSMICSKREVVKDKVMTINKNCGYIADVSKEQIQTESEKCLRTVMELEKKGYKVNLNIMYQTKIENKVNIIVLNIKKANQRMNIKQVAFPMVHPSMLRRIIFRVREYSQEFENNSSEYGGSINDIDMLKGVKELKGTYFLPNITKEQEITDIEKYRVE